MDTFIFAPENVYSLYIFVLKDTFFLLYLAQILHVVSYIYIYISFHRLYGIFLIYREYPFSLPRLISLYIVFFRFCPDYLIYKISIYIDIKHYFLFILCPSYIVFYLWYILLYIDIPFSF